MSARPLPTGRPGVFEPPLVTRSIEVVHPCAVVSMKITREVDAADAGGVCDVSGRALQFVGEFADGHGVSFEYKDPRTLRDLRDVLDAAIEQAERDGLLDVGEAAARHDPDPLAPRARRLGRRRA